jgi:putative ABC transport system permease protein
VTTHDVGAPIRGNGPAGPPQSDRAGGRSGRRADRSGNWLGSWRVSLRMARRDVLRAKGLSTLIVLMVLLPVTLISYAITGLQAEWDGPAAVENSLGGAQARIDRVDTNVVIQDAK